MTTNTTEPKQRIVSENYFPVLSIFATFLELQVFIQFSGFYRI